MTTHPQSRLTHFPIQEIDLPSSFAVDFLSEFVRAAEFDKTGKQSSHSIIVSLISHKIGEKLGLERKEMKELFFAALLHDIGGIAQAEHISEKLVAIPDIFGQKNDFFIFAHSHRSETILKSFPTFRKISEIVKSHHEFFDGGGFPSGLSGEKIPLFSRIIRIADTVDILLKLHSVNKKDDLISLLNIVAGEEFDPAIYGVFAQLIQESDLFEVLKDPKAVELEIEAIKKLMPDNYYFSAPDTINRFFRTVAVMTDNITSYEDTHSLRVAEFAVNIAYLLKLDPDEILLVRWASFLHDIGKIKGDRSVYTKKDKLSESEWSKIREHPQKSFDIINKVSGMEKIAYYILHHHENFDGSGYPDNLSANRIPLASRILRVADAFDAMTTDRIYHRKKDWQRALKELKNFSGTQFDPEIVELFIDNLS